MSPRASSADAQRHPSPVLLSTRISSGTEELLDERTEPTVVAQYQGLGRAKANQPLLGWTRPGAGGGTAIRSVKINSLTDVLGVNLIGPALHRPAPRGMPDISTRGCGQTSVQRLELDEYLTQGVTISRRARNGS